ncbi:prolyl oligopeptidase family serine peptidase [Aliikangiella maris]|uniref:S9 family peptidase n=2 Tax=Aliikangiella maris TaxID=3162458 RepID=A0ABV2BTK1_9GAMM
MNNTNDKIKVRLCALLLLGGVSACNNEKEAVTQQTSETSAQSVSKQDNLKKIATSHQQYSAEEFFKTVSLSGSSINHDGSAILVSSDVSGVFNVYRYPMNGGESTQLTHSTSDATFGVSWFPQDDRILYVADNGGNELTHIYVRELDGKTTDITPGKNLRAAFAGWHKDKKAFYVTTNERNPKITDLYRYSVEGYQRELLYQNDNNFNIGVVSPDGRWLSLTETITNANSNLYLVDLQAENQPAKLLTPHDGDISYASFTFTPDSRYLIYSTNEHGEYAQAWQYELATDKQSLFYQANWDVSFVQFSDDGKYRVVGVNQDAQTQLDMAEVASGKQIAMPELPAGDLRGVNFSANSKKMAFYINSDTSPSNLFSYVIGENKAKRLTRSLPSSIDEAHLVMSEVKRFKSFDGLTVPGLLYRPKTASASQKVPALIWVHGGPGGQSRKGYRAAIQHLVNQGYAIFAVNNRGSSGYGKTFYHLDDKKHGQDDLQDIVYGKKYLQTLNWIDQDRIGVMGGSYGGYMTMAAMAFTQEFKVGINIFGVTNWVRTLESIPPWWESFKKYFYNEMGDPATDQDRLRAISPLFHAENITNPVLIVQGANDPRVLQIESDEMVAAIRKNNVPVEYVLFDDEGHGFRKKSNRITASNAYLKFLQKHL